MVAIKNLNLKHLNE